MREWLLLSTDMLEWESGEKQKKNKIRKNKRRRQGGHITNKDYILCVKIKPLRGWWHRPFCFLFFFFSFSYSKIEAKELILIINKIRTFFFVNWRELVRRASFAVRNSSNNNIILFSFFSRFSFRFTKNLVLSQKLAFFNINAAKRKDFLMNVWIYSTHTHYITHTHPYDYIVCTVCAHHTFIEDLVI